jgi:hypothetical protein
MDFVIAGASFPCGAGQLGEVASRHGFSAIFIDHPRNAASIDAGLSPLRIETSLPEDVARRNGLFLPLLESWVSEGRKLPECSGLRFDRRAATISRSKYALSMTLSEAGISHVPRYRVGSSEEALQRAFTCGYPVILRADSGYSGRGVWVANSPDDLRAFWAWQPKERASADFVEMRSVLDANDDLPIIEPWITGDEWSIDCVVGPAGTYLIRACEKMTAIVSGRPVTLGYRLTDSVDLWAELRQTVERWTRVLFRAGEVSFACFDIRRHPNGNLVPLDFGVRLGGDQIPLLVRRAGRNGNPYAAALDSALAADPGRMGSVQAGFAIVHAFADKPGVFGGIKLSESAEVIDIKPSGFRVESQEQASTFRCVGTVFTQFETRSAFFHACERAADWIHVDCN